MILPLMHLLINIQDRLHGVVGGSIYLVMSAKREKEN